MAVLLRSKPSCCLGLEASSCLRCWLWAAKGCELTVGIETFIARGVCCAWVWWAAVTAFGTGVCRWTVVKFCDLDSDRGGCDVGVWACEAEDGGLRGNEGSLLGLDGGDDLCVKANAWLCNKISFGFYLHTNCVLLDEVFIEIRDNINRIGYQTIKSLRKSFSYILYFFLFFF